VGTPRNIVIIDDDNAFANLLTEVLSQGDYHVKAYVDPAAGSVALDAGSFDLAIIDQQMEGITGAELLRKIRIKSKIPVIIISGYLNPTITPSLINQGVSGIFFKPLNIFALLKRIEEIFQGKVISSGIVVQASPATEMRGLTRTPFTSPLTKELFLKKIQSLASFKGVLLLIGDGSGAFSAVAEELIRRAAAEDCLLKFPPSPESGKTVDGAEATTLVRKLLEDKKTATFFIRNVKDITGEIKDVLFKIARHDSPFDKSPPVRFIFCLEKELDELYESGAIDDEMYIFMGNVELRLPRADSSARRGLTAAPREAPSPSAGRILVVDDEAPHAQMIVDLLDVAGYKALMMTSPAEALQTLKKEKFSLILTDFRMPGIDGIDFVSQARTLSQDVPIFIITGDIQLPEMVRVANMGITRLITKPIDPRGLIREIDGVLKRSV
jgi:DNA-binding response OmpR family regulator